MKNLWKRICAVFVSAVMAASFLCCGGVLIPEAAAVGEEAVALTVTARYSSNRLSWTGEAGRTYTVERAASPRGLYTALGTVTGAAWEYIDEDAGEGTQYFYRLSDGADPLCEGVRAEHETGLYAVLQSAAYHRVFGGGREFANASDTDGASEEEVAAVNALGGEGTILLRAKHAGVGSSTIKTLYTDDANYFVGGNQSRFRYSLGQQWKSNVGNDLSDLAYTGTITHCGGGWFQAGVHGESGATNQAARKIRSSYLNENNKLFFSGISSLTLGGNAVTPVTVYYALVTGELMSDSELNALLSANGEPVTEGVTIHFDGTLVPLEAGETVGWASLQGPEAQSGSLELAAAGEGNDNGSFTLDRDGYLKTAAALTGSGTYTVEFTETATNTSETFTLQAAPEPTEGTAAAGYSKVKLTWTGDGTGPYVLRRAETREGLETAPALTTVSNAAVYWDEVGMGAGPYWYRVDIQSGGRVFRGVPFQADRAAGWEAMKANAAFCKEYRDVTFDGSENCVQALTDEEFNAIKDLARGTILVQYKYTGASSAAEHHILLGMGSESPGTCNGSDGNYFSYGELNGRMRFEWIGGFKANDVTLEDRPIWHTAALVDGSADSFVSVSGTVGELNHWNNAAFDGFLSRVTDPTSFGVGGFAEGAPADTVDHVGAFWEGGVNYVLITDEVLTQEEANELTLTETVAVEPALALNAMFSATAEDATWVFTGGAAAQGRVEDIGGARSYIGEFEEYIRWTKATGTNQLRRQRYVMSTARAGQTVRDAADSFDARIAPLDPRAVVYLVSQADVNGGTDETALAAFRAGLTDFLEKALARKGGTALAVVQTPYARGTDSENERVARYADAAKEAVAALDSPRVFVVDHFAQTSADPGWAANCLNANGTPNAKGHLELGRQLSVALVGSDVNYPTDTPPVAANYPNDLTPVAAPGAYLAQAPTVTAGADSLRVTIPAETSVTQWRYTLEVADSFTLSGETALTGKDFTIDGLPAGKTYTLTVTSADGTLGLPVMTGTVADGEAGTVKTAERNDAQRALADRMAGGDSLTWLFMGDSITHGAKWLMGYDSTPQSVEKFLKDDLGRKNDIVINTGNSSATTQSTVDNLTQRLTKYEPDVVAVMLGTNDANSNSNVPVETYKANLRTILDAIGEKGAIAILRTPVPTRDPSGGRNTNLPNYRDAMLAVAEDYPNAIVVDQYAYWNEFLTELPFLWSKLFGETGAQLHPNPNGQLLMTHQFLRDTGLWRDESAIADLFYEIPLSTRQSAAETPVTTQGSGISLEGADLSDRAGVTLGGLTLTAMDDAGRSYAVRGKGSETLTLNDLPQGTYRVSAKGYNAADGTTWSFRDQTVELGRPVQVAFDVLLDQHYPQAGLAVGDKVGGLSVSAAAPAGDYTFTLAAGDGDDDNACFAIEGSELRVAQVLTGGRTYRIRVRAAWEDHAAETAITLTAMSEERLFRVENVALTDGGGLDLSERDYAERVYQMAEGTFIVQYTASTPGTFVGVSNQDGGKSNNHFHFYSGAAQAGHNTRYLATEVRGGNNTDGAFSHNGKEFQVVTGRVRVLRENQAQVNTVAFRADAEAGTYTLFANGGVVYTWEMGENYKFLRDIEGLNSLTLGKVVRGGSDAYNGFRGTIHYLEAYGAPLTDGELLQITGETDAGQYIFQTGDGARSNYFRIPALTTLADGRTMVAAIDARHSSTEDSANNIDLAVARSTDGGRTWGEVTMPIHFDDVADDPQKLPAGSAARIFDSACAIDPVIVATTQADGSERVFLMVDVFPCADEFLSGNSSTNALAGSGFTEIDGEKYLKLKKAGETEYNYTVRAGGVIYHNAAGEATEYSVDEYFNLLENGVPLTVGQKSYTWNGSAFARGETGKDVAMNVMYADAAFTVLPTSYLYLIHSDDGGATWSAPVNLNGMVKSEEMAFFGVGPGRGLQLQSGAHAGRIVLPVYEIAGANANQCRVIYSDDYGETWAAGAAVNRPGVSKMTESQVVEMPDGSLRVFGRTTNQKIAMAASLDGGETWTDAALIDALPMGGSTSSGCQLSVINYDGLIDGKPALVLSAPVNIGNRKDGRVRIGLIEEHPGAAGADRYSINWKYEYSVDGAAEYFAYSCLAQTPTGVGILYENFNTKQPMDVVRYLDLTLDRLKGRSTVEITPRCDPDQGTVSGGGNWNVGDTAFVSARAAEGYEFQYWQSRYGETLPSSTEADYYFTATRDMEPWAVFRRVAEKTYGVFGTVLNENGAGVVGALVALRKGSEPVAETHTGAGGAYQLGSVPPGDYSLVVTRGAQTMTYLVTVVNADTEKNVVMRDGAVNAVLEVGADAPAVAVGGLEDAAERVKQRYPTGGEITVTMTVERVAEEAMPPAEAAEFRQTAGEGKTLEYLEISMKVTVGDETRDLHATSDLMTIVIPFDFGKAAEGAVGVLRRHDNTVSELPTGWNPTEHGNEEGIELSPERGTVTLHARYFSTYAIVYQAAAAEPAPARPRWYSCPKGRTCPLKRFVDLKATEWYHDGIHYCLDKGYMEGYGDARFCPQDRLTRAMLAQLLYNKEGRPAAAGASGFTDVAPGAWYADAIAWAAERGLVEGFGDGTFRPLDRITREQMATLLYRYEQKVNGGGFTGAWSFPLEYADRAQVSDWAREAVCWMTMRGLMEGTPEGNVEPGGLATRAEAAALVQRFCTVDRT